jgi:hypothetical protein
MFIVQAPGWEVSNERSTPSAKRTTVVVYSMLPLCNEKLLRFHTRNSYWRGRLSTLDLLALTSLDQLLLIMQTFFSFVQNKLA